MYDVVSLQRITSKRTMNKIYNAKSLCCFFQKKMRQNKSLHALQEFQKLIMTTPYIIASKRGKFFLVNKLIL